MRGRHFDPSGVVPSPQEDVISPTNVSVSDFVATAYVASFSWSPFPPLGRDSAPVNRGLDQLRDRSDPGISQLNISGNVCGVPSSSFDPSLLFPFSDSGFSSLSASLPPSSSSSLLPSSAPGFSTVALSVPRSSVTIFSLPSVVPSVLSISSAPFLTTPSFAPSPAPFPSFSFFGISSSAASIPSLVSSSVSAPLLPPLASAPPAPASFWPSSSASPFSSLGCPPGVSSVSSSAPSGDFASYQAKVLGLSDEYQALGRWFVASGGSDFPAYLSSHFPHLYSDFHLDFSCGSSRFLAVLASSSLPLLPLLLLLFTLLFLRLLQFLPPLFRSLPLLFLFHPWFGLWLRCLLYSFAPLPSAPPFPSAPPAALSLTPPTPSVRFPSVSAPVFSQSLGSVLGGSGVSAVSLASSVPHRPVAPVSAPSLFRPFALNPSSSLQVSSTLPPPSTASVPSFSSPGFAYLGSSSTPFDPASAFAFGHSSDPPADVPPDDLPRDLDQAAPAVAPESAR